LTRFFLDTVFLQALNNPNDPHHADASEVNRKLRSSGQFRSDRDLFLSDLVFREVTEGLLDDCGYRTAMTVRRSLRANYSILRTREDDLANAFDGICSRFHSGAGSGVGLVDAVSVLLMQRNRIGLIVSTDSSFDLVPTIRRIWLHNVDEIRTL